MEQYPHLSGSRVTEIMIFKLIWQHSNKRSFISGMHLREFQRTDLWFNCFAHVLSKSQTKFPYFKYYAKNIALLTPGEHALLDQGTEEQRISYSLDIEERTKGKFTADWGKLKSLEEELRLEYKKSFPTTKGILIGYKYSAEEVFKIVGKLNKQFFESQIKK